MHPDCGEILRRLRESRPALEREFPLRWTALFGSVARGEANDDSDMAGLRNRIVHNYAGVDLEIVWQIVSVSLPDLRSKLDALP